MNEILKGFLALVSGGAIWEGFKFLYPDLQRYFSSKAEAKKIIYKNLDPILKSSSELFGKLESLAKEDFSTFIRPDSSNSKHPIHNQKYVLYLFAQFLGQLEYLRRESQYTMLTRQKKGKELLRFMDTLESRKYRILDRSIQRIIGECMISNIGQDFRIMPLNQFMENIDNATSNLAKWIAELDKVLFLVKNKQQRQKVLIFGVIVASLIDHFDPKYKIVRRRGIYKNKLSIESKSKIKNHLTKHYLFFLKQKERYY